MKIVYSIEWKKMDTPIWRQRANWAKMAKIWPKQRQMKSAHFFAHLDKVVPDRGVEILRFYGLDSV